jgi:hypothetical protein
MIAARIDKTGPMKCEAMREKTNAVDKNAIKIRVREKGNPYDKLELGYLRRQVAAELAPKIDSGEVVISEVWLTAVYWDEGEGDLTVTMKKPLKSHG